MKTYKIIYAYGLGGGELRDIEQKAGNSFNAECIFLKLANRWTKPVKVLRVQSLG